VAVVTKRIAGDDRDPAVVDEVPVYHIGPTGPRRASGKWLLVPALFAALWRQRSRFDVIVCIDYRGIGVAAVAAGMVLGKPVIAQGEVAGVLAGAASDAGSGLAPEGAIARAVKSPLRAIYRRADCVVCIGRDLEREALRAGVPRDRVVYLPHGVDADRFRPPAAGEQARLRERFGWPPVTPVVLFVGRLSVEKGVMDLLEAWRIANRGDARLVLVGPDMIGHPWDAGGPARAFVQAHGLTGSVRFEGPTDDPAPFYRAADVFVQPSHFEALGNTAIEAMASGLPVLASAIGGLLDFCVDDVNALLHPPRSAEAIAAGVERLLGDAPLRARLAAAGRQTAVDRFELHDLMAQYTALIERHATRGARA
jgi:glycosyltransferase involved in cell wall biosynthesis